MMMMVVRTVAVLLMVTWMAACEWPTVFHFVYAEVFTLLQKFDPALSEEIRERDQERRNKGAGRSRHVAARQT